MLKQLFYDFRSRVNSGDVLENIKRLRSLEPGGTFPDVQRAADAICTMMKKSGFPMVENIQVPADGKNVCLDHLLPPAWKAKKGKLILCDRENTIAADFSLDPGHLIMGSRSADPAVRTVRIITEPQFLAGEDPYRSLILLNHETRPEAKILKSILDSESYGFITDHAGGVENLPPDTVPGISCLTEISYPGMLGGNKDFIGFSVSRKMGEKIRELASKGELKAKMECDGENYAGNLPLVTALVPGRKQAELLIVAHAFAPLSLGASCGVPAAIESARILMESGYLEYSLRLVFSMRQYGLAAFLDNKSGASPKVAGIDLGDLPVEKNAACLLEESPSVQHPGFSGVLHKVAEELGDFIPLKYAGTACSGDLFPAALMMPMIRARSGKTNFSRLLEPDGEKLTESCALASVLCHEITTVETRPESLKKVTMNIPLSPWRKYAGTHIYRRKIELLPKDLCRVPENQRKNVPDPEFPFLLCMLDGKNDLASLISELEKAHNIVFTDAKIKKYIDFLNYLTDWGYLDAVSRKVISRNMVEKALRTLGVVPGDVLLVHSSFSRCGYLENGAETLIQGIMDSVGREGTVLFPAFTRPYLYLGSSWNKNWWYHPYDETDPSQIWVGTVPQILLKKFPEAIRSRHVTHSWAALGKYAEECTECHEPEDPPANWNSPMAKALERNGKILYFGSGLAPTTFLHFLETVNQAPFLQPAVCRVRCPDGSLKTVFIEQHLPGHRDFYRSDAENSKFFRRALREGLCIREQPLGMGKLQLIELKQLYEIGMRLWAKDPHILLCDDPDCFFCSRFHQDSVGKDA